MEAGNSVLDAPEHLMLGRREGQNIIQIGVKEHPIAGASGTRMSLTNVNFLGAAVNLKGNGWY